MEKFTKEIRKRMGWLGALALFCVGLGVFDTFFAPPAIKESKAFALLSGFTAAMLLMALILFLRYRKALADEIRLKRLYHEEHDELMVFIRGKAGQPLILITSVLMLLSAIIAGYFSLTVMKVLVAASAAQMLISLGIKLYYLRSVGGGEE